MINNIEQRTMLKVTRHVIYFLFLMSVFCIIDRTNLGIAALQMNQDLAFTATVFGMGASMFYLSYILLEVPSTLMLARVGARVWLSRLMISWGIISALMAVTYSEHSFYLLRFLLGAAEAGFYPGVFFYLSFWVPARYQGKAFTIFMMATPIGMAVGAPISASLLSLSWLGLAGWKWMFILEGVPAVIIGFMALSYLKDRPKQASWLSTEESEWLNKEIAAEHQNKEDMTLWQMLCNWKVILLCLFFFCLYASFFGFAIWLPQIIKNVSAVTNVQVGLLASLPYLLAAIALVFYGRFSDRYVNRRGAHIGGATFVSCLCLAVSAYSLSNPLFSYITVILAIISMMCAFGVFGVKAVSYFTGIASAGSLGLMTSVGAAGGFLGPLMIGYFRDLTNGFSTSMFVLAGFLFVATVIILLLPEHRVKD